MCLHRLILYNLLRVIRMENYQQWDYCEFQGENCIIYDIDDNIITLALWESSYTELPLHNISSSLVSMLELKQRSIDEGTALMQLSQPKIMSLSGRRVALNPSQSLVCLNEGNKAYSFSGLFSTVHVSANENGYMSDEFDEFDEFDDEEYLSLGAVVKDTDGIETKMELDNFLTHFRANTRYTRNSSTLRSMRVMSLKM